MLKLILCLAHTLIRLCGKSEVPELLVITADRDARRSDGSNKYEAV